MFSTTVRLLLVADVQLRLLSLLVVGVMHKKYLDFFCLPGICFSGASLRSVCIIVGLICVKLKQNEYATPKQSATKAHHTQNIILRFAMQPYLPNFQTCFWIALRIGRMLQSRPVVPISLMLVHISDRLPRLHQALTGYVATNELHPSELCLMPVFVFAHPDEKWP